MGIKTKSYHPIINQWEDKTCYGVIMMQSIANSIRVAVWVDRSE